jgi:endonuclease-3
VKLKFKLHFFLIQHGRTCPACRGGAKGDQKCQVWKEVSAVRNKQFKQS